MTSEETIRLGVIGAGGIANGVHLPALEQLHLAEVVAVCDIIEQRAEKAAEKFHIPGPAPCTRRCSSARSWRRSSC